MDQGTSEQVSPVIGQGATEDAALSSALARLRAELPGWWWSVGNCSVSADATIGPDRNGPDAYLLADRFFDEGISNDLRHPVTVADALHGAIDIAKQAKRSREHKRIRG